MQLESCGIVVARK